MEDLLRSLEKWRVAEPGVRHKLAVNASHRFAAENAAFIILAWDYVFRPSDRKAEGLRDVFIKNEGKMFVNLSFAGRRNAMALLTAGTPPVNGLAARMALAAGPATRMRGPAVMSAPSMRGRAAGVSSRPMAGRVAGRAGGFRAGGAGNYNLVTKALNIAVPEIDVVIREAVGQPEDFHASEKVAERLHYLLTEQLPLLRGYWGADLDGLF